MRAESATGWHVGKVVRTAVVSHCGQYRYSLGRDWQEGDGRVLWVMLNPSTGDALRDDRTITKCCGFSQRWGFEQLSIVNLFAFRTAYPRDLHSASLRQDVVGPDNAEHIAMECRGARQVIVGWGAHGLRYPRQKGIVLDQLRELVGEKLLCLGMPKGEPRHPLMLPYTTEREPFRGYR